MIRAGIAELLGASASTNITLAKRCAPKLR